MFDSLSKRALSMPPPWQYDVVPKWAEDKINFVPNKNSQICKFQWKGVDKENMTLEKPQRIKLKKPNMSVKKCTYVDWILMQNTNENYPKPGPANYFMDLKTAKKYYKENAEIFDKKEKNKIEKSKLP